MLPRPALRSYPFLPRIFWPEIAVSQFGIIYVVLFLPVKGLLAENIVGDSLTTRVSVPIIKESIPQEKSMKICRCLTEDGQIHYGLHNPETPGRMHVLAGDIFNSLQPTDRHLQILTYLPPVAPPNIFALGLSYRKHADEIGTDVAPYPIVFSKATTSVTGHNTKILLPAAGPDQVDYEGELAVIIGTTGKNIKKTAAMDHVLGYTCANDVSARDWQFKKQQGQWTRGKGFDTFCPLGPCLITRDEIPDPNGLGIKTMINDLVVQEASTAGLLYDIATIVSDLSRSLTLLPGTVILTGTPEGVGFTRQPPLFLREGDRVTVTIAGIGTLVNWVQKERP
jgi:2-keto-4-pentenoate hydratase/2-oxohepta-3-ene-1,7-dioic acid hydratase in catechol pathway